MCGGIGVTLQCAPGGVTLSVPWVVAVCPLEGYVPTERMFRKGICVSIGMNMYLLKEYVSNGRMCERMCVY